MILWLNFDSLGELFTISSQKAAKHEYMNSNSNAYIASSNFFSANALLPSALRASAIARIDICVSAKDNKSEEF